MFVDGHSLFHGDALEKLDLIDDNSIQLVVTSPPYNIGKEYERDKRLTLDEYVNWLRPIIEKLCKKVSQDGHLCWQTGNFIDKGEIFPLDLYFYSIFKAAGFKLRNRIIWHFNFGRNAENRFSGRYETILWFSKSDEYIFNLDPVRIPQRYPGKKHSSKKGLRAGTPSGNPLGKNPSDFWEFDPEKAFKLNPIWDFPNVKANHPEKTTHPCQFPSELAERCVLALTKRGDIVLDPFLGSGSTAIAALLHDRNVIGIDKDSRYIELAGHRLALLSQNNLPRRPLGTSIYVPTTGSSVAQWPAEWAKKELQEGEGNEQRSVNIEVDAQEEKNKKTQAFGRGKKAVKS